MTDEHADAEITMRIPALGQYALLARVLVSACGSLGGFSVAELDDLRLLANEAFHSLRTIGSGPIDIRLLPAPGVIAIEMSSAQGVNRTWADVDSHLVGTVANVLGAQALFDQEDGRSTFRSTVRTGTR